MKPSEAFRVAVRVIGLVGWLVSFFYLLSTIVVILASTWRPGLSPWWHYFTSAAICFAVGWFLLRSADRVVAFAYRQRNSDASDV